MIKLNEPGVRLGLVLNLQLNSVLAEWTHLLAININIDIIVVVLIAIFRVLEYQKRERKYQQSVTTFPSPPTVPVNLAPC